MSQQPNEPPVRSSMSPVNGRPRDRSSETASPFLRSDGGSFRQTSSGKNDGQASVELEGSTLGSSSRDGNRRTPSQRRTQSSGGFLLDSLPRPRSTRVSLHRPRPSEPPQEKRSVPEPDIVVPKKRSKFPWIRHKHHASISIPDDSSSNPNSAWQPSTTPDRQPSGNPSQPELREDNVTHSTPGLDRDSIQIVNLALNLNESRRRTASGIPLGPESRRPISVSQPTVPTVNGYAYSPRAREFQRESPYRNFTQVSGRRLSHGTLPSLDQSSVVNLLPPSAIEDQRAYEFSESTLARAERARNHFDLFHEYMRLLPSLPPLRDAVTADAESKPHRSNRGYNPLQMIRNRKVRYREKCSIDADAEGWHDVERVHQWINNVEQKYSHREYDPIDCLKLPPFQQDRRHVSIGEHEGMDMMPTSPGSSLRRVSRTSSTKARRPRIDWKISPAELLADAAWLEYGANKTKVVDKDGCRLYPNPKELVIMDTGDDIGTPSKQKRLSVEVRDPGEGHSSPRTSLSSSHPALAQEFKSVGRGRHRHRFRSHSHSLRSRSASSKRKPSRWDHGKMRSGSVSSSSSSDTRPSVDEKPRMSREHIRDHVQRFVENAQSASRTSRAKFPDVRNADIDRGRTPQPTEPLSVNKKQARKRMKDSFSSAGSLDDRHDLRVSLEGMDSTAPNSPARIGYFPSIAVNLSPPSSRSPSPAKKGLRHKIASRHERSKSKQADREREREDELPEPETLRQRNLTALTEGASKLEPSPLPDVVSSSYHDDQGTQEGNRGDGHRSRKGPHLPESKLRGIFKGPGRITKIVGNEVSKVGDLILKKEDPESRKSSSATTFPSDDSGSDEESRSDRKYGSKGLLRRLPTFTDEPGRLTRGNSEKNSSRSFIPSLPTFTSPLRQDERSETADTTDFGSPNERVPSPQNYGSRDSPKKFALPRSKTLDFSPSLHTGRTKRHEIKDSSIPFSLARPPVTGLANARASPGLSPEGRRPGLSGASRAWSISGRSIRTLIDTGVPGKPEVERTRALLLSSGIKAREITRRAHTFREPVPHWLQSSVGPGTSVPRVTRIGEFDLAAQCLLQRFEHTQHSFQQSMHHFSTSTSYPLRYQLKNLEDLVNNSLTPRVRTTANDAEDLCVQLNTTSTLAVKQLSDALDKGLRKRRRRLRWIRRTGFMVLEWALVAVLWWVWLIVMGFKFVRGVFRGVFTGIRWVLWL
ncbi:hypothetical protein DTO013E5_9614 [Penicillium roqueforti]|uniref:Genomic scaffold, ProqFM164S01 n=1 Tax=Penicillium roqueforti (strain FM164) TaxID=1365484 RepID=W6PR66_PENRF|nr:uncharacterized protein LCP9604111_6357 [Penicillium roqueforti]CDM26688.1 unnamed protein product [Penicillium roqueforti FM164]KAF9247658.1 hypothetical protein LCP9604111_6357 [Penicillium roqueforti]KAI1834999.1 hypothetical protein CBS147337_4553 [Penicillium roqueforti]KAI2676838.1 hypothetical protein CBS147355_5940 [Penicillium roqueforti]KAI2683712.1 hypothetical protein LCP963914a_6113 [Penicillium roqueforti]